LNKEKFDNPELQQIKESFGEKYDKIYKAIGKVNQLQKFITDSFCELGMIAAQQKNIVAVKSTDNNKSAQCTCETDGQMCDFCYNQLSPGELSDLEG
jgi:hypothetical protein